MQEEKAKPLDCTFEEYAAKIGELVPRVTADCDWLIELKFIDGMSIEKAARVVRVYLATVSPVEDMAELLGEPLKRQANRIAD